MVEPSHFQLFTVVAMPALVIAVTLMMWNPPFLQRQSGQTSDLDQPMRSIKIDPQQELLRPKFIRISRIPKTIGVEELRAWLETLTTSFTSQNQAQEDCDVSKFKISLAPVDSKYSQAIVRTAFDLKIPRTETLVGPSGHELDVDDHFKGMTVLHVGESTDAEEDILVE